MVILYCMFVCGGGGGGGIESMQLILSLCVFARARVGGALQFIS